MIPLLLPNVLIVLILSVSVVFADDFKTLDGKEYKNAKVVSVVSDGFQIRTTSGAGFPSKISKIYFWELPQEVQERFRQKLEEDQKRRDEQKQAVLAKAQSIRIPTVEFLGATPEEALQFLDAMAHDNDPDGTGVVIMGMNIVNPASPRINLLLHDVTLFEATTAVAQQMGMLVEVGTDMLLMVPKPE
jgi:hypothetical protein